MTFLYTHNTHTLAVDHAERFLKQVLQERTVREAKRTKRYAKR